MMVCVEYEIRGMRKSVKAGVRNSGSQGFVERVKI